MKVINLIETLYDVMNDSFFSNRIVSTLGGLVPIALFIFAAISIKSTDKKEKRFKKGFLIIISIFAILSLLNIFMECDDFNNNYFVHQYEDGHYEVVSGKVSSIETTDSEIYFRIGDKKFMCISKDFNSRGYHIEDYNDNPFKDGDTLKIYYITQDEAHHSSYPEKIIMKVERV